MTRTERATSPRAIIKDRSESKSGIDKRTPKNGGGPHNWGRLEDEHDLEEAALYDEERDFDEEGTHHDHHPVWNRRSRIRILNSCGPSRGTTQEELICQFLPHLDRTGARRGPEVPQACPQVARYVFN